MHHPRLHGYNYANPRAFSSLQQLHQHCHESVQGPFLEWCQPLGWWSNPCVSTWGCHKSCGKVLGFAPTQKELDGGNPWTICHVRLSKLCWHDSRCSVQNLHLLRARALIFEKSLPWLQIGEWASLSVLLCSLSRRDAWLTILFSIPFKRFAPGVWGKGPTSFKPWVLNNLMLLLVAFYEKKTKKFGLKKKVSFKIEPCFTSESNQLWRTITKVGTAFFTLFCNEVFDPQQRDDSSFHSIVYVWSFSIWEKEIPSKILFKDRQMLGIKLHHCLPCSPHQIMMGLKLY